MLLHRNHRCPDCNRYVHGCLCGESSGSDNIHDSFRCFLCVFGGVKKDSPPPNAGLDSSDNEELEEETFPLSNKKLPGNNVPVSDEKSTVVRSTVFM